MSTKLIRVAWPLPCLAILGGLFAQAPPAGGKFALLVGVNDYHHSKFANLNFAENDAVEMSKVLKQSGYQVTLLTGKNATRAAIAKALKEVTAQRGRNDIVLVGMAGHGLLFDPEDKKGKEKFGSYFCPYDADPKMGSTMVPLDEMVTQLGDCGAGAKLLLVDACREGTTRGIDTLPQVPRGMGVLLACGPGQFAFEYKEKKHGLFFYHVLEGLRGKAGNAQGEVTWDRLRTYVKESVPGKVPAGGRQDPDDIANVGKIPPLLTVTTRPVVPPKSADTVKPVEVAAPAPSSTLGKYVEVDLGGGVKMKLVRIDPGKFMMGSPENEPGREPTTMSGKSIELLHEVEITRAFYMGVYPVTQAEYEKIIGSNPSVFHKNGALKEQVVGLDTARFPVDSVGWYHARDFCSKLSKKEGKTFDLPTEAEWEYCCRAGTTTTFHYGNSLTSKQATFAGQRRTTPVGSYEPNAFGLYDMHGNVTQHCKDWFQGDYYVKSPSRDPQGPAAGGEHVIRGGYYLSYGEHCRSASRDCLPLGYAHSGTGFRIVMR